MKLYQNLMVFYMLVPLTICTAQIRNATTDTVKIYGNCGMCEATIEKAGNLKNVAKVDWNKDTKMATLTYDAKSTNQDEILKRIALSGYDSDKFLAPEKTYAQLPACCQYERVNIAPIMDEVKSKGDGSLRLSTMDMINNPEMVKEPTKSETINQDELNPLADIFAIYFEVKDALVQSDGNLAASKSGNLLTAVNAVKMKDLKMDVHMVWMKILDDLKKNVTAMANSKDVENQRNHFINLSNNIYALIKITKYEEPVYYQFCPMANDGKGANWLSKENVIKNPYYGSQMLSCGKVVETIIKMK